MDWLASYQQPGAVHSIGATMCFSRLPKRRDIALDVTRVLGSVPWSTGWGLAFQIRPRTTASMNMLDMLEDAFVCDILVVGEIYTQPSSGCQVDGQSCKVGR